MRYMHRHRHAGAHRDPARPAPASVRRAGRHQLLRAGLDIPECGFVAILDADKEGFLRSETFADPTTAALARNVGKAILYADNVTGSMERAMVMTNGRREKQLEYNAANGITPESVKSRIADILDPVYEKDRVRADISQFVASTMPAR